MTTGLSILGVRFAHEDIQAASVRTDSLRSCEYRLHLFRFVIDGQFNFFPVFYINRRHCYDGRLPMMKRSFLSCRKAKSHFLVQKAAAAGSAMHRCDFSSIYANTHYQLARCVSLKSECRQRRNAIVSPPLGRRRPKEAFEKCIQFEFNT